MERTLVLFKPDCVERRLVGRLLARFEDKGFSIIAMKMMHLTKQLARKHYAEHVQNDWYPLLEAFITAGPLVAAIIEGPQAIDVVRNMVGATSGLEAVPGTIRGDFSCSRQRNLIHASAGWRAAAREIKLFFSRAEIHRREPALRPWLRAPDED